MSYPSCAPSSIPRRHPNREGPLQVRVLLAELPRLLREVLEDTMRHEPGLALVGFVEPGEDAGASVGETYADVLIVGEAAIQTSNGWRSLLRTHPKLRLLSLSGDGRHLDVYELNPLRTHIGEASPDVLVEWIRNTPQPVPLLTREGPKGAFAPDPFETFARRIGKGVQ